MNSTPVVRIENQIGDGGLEGKQRRNLESPIIFWGPVGFDIESKVDFGLWTIDSPVGWPYPCAHYPAPCIKEPLEGEAARLCDKKLGFPSPPPLEVQAMAGNYRGGYGGGKV